MHYRRCKREAHVSYPQGSSGVPLLEPSFSLQSSPTLAVPLMTREAFAAVVGLPLGVLIAQCDRGYWPQLTKGKRVFINVEAVRVQSLRKAAATGL